MSHYIRSAIGRRTIRFLNLWKFWPSILKRRLIMLLRTEKKEGCKVKYRLTRQINFRFQTSLVLGLYNFHNIRSWQKIHFSFRETSTCINLTRARLSVRYILLRYIFLNCLLPHLAEQFLQFKKSYISSL